MPTLSYRCTEENGLSFELLVDGEPLGDLLGAHDTAFPHWMVEDGLPRWPHGPPDAPEERIVGVCSCGEYGCSHARCRVTREGDDVIFHEFGFVRKVFRFGAANYDAVCKEIAAIARQYRERDAAGRR
jgi:hypothetical protein